MCLRKKKQINRTWHAYVPFYFYLQIYIKIEVNRIVSTRFLVCFFFFFCKISSHIFFSEEEGSNNFLKSIYIFVGYIIGRFKTTQGDQNQMWKMNYVEKWALRFLMYSSPKEFIGTLIIVEGFLLLLFVYSFLTQKYCIRTLFLREIKFLVSAKKQPWQKWKGEKKNLRFFFRCFNHSSIHLNCERVVWI